MSYAQSTKVSLSDKRLVIEAPGRSPESYSIKSCHRKIMNRYVEQKLQSHVCTREDVDGVIVVETTVKKQTLSQKVPVCSKKEQPISNLFLSLQNCK